MQNDRNNNRSQAQEGIVNETATKARQGNLGKPVLAVLIGGLILAMIAWGAVEFWGERIDTDSRSTGSLATGSATAEPSGAGTFDNNPAAGGSRPPEATDRSPSPSGSGGAPASGSEPR
ncbi:hypothetical protein [Rhizobium sp. RAF56]|uniref:hypothetical protein n=1 Tax=Rhizobium sp. RAF56 TaxID=3233062 RepID=UPI003F9CDD12